MVCFDGAADALPGLVCVDVESIQIFTDIVQRHELWVNRGSDVGLDPEIEEPGMEPGGRTPAQSLRGEVGNVGIDGSHKGLQDRLLKSDCGNLNP